MWSKTWPSQSRQLRSDLLSHSNLIRHSFVMCPPGHPIILLSSWPIRKLISRLCPLSESLSLDFTRVFHETSCERSQSRRRSPQPLSPSPAQASAAWSSVPGWRQTPPAFFLFILFQSLKCQQTRPNLIILLAKTGGIYNYIKVVIDTFLFFPNVYYFSLDNRPTFWALSSIICVIKRSRTRCLLIIIIYEYVLIDIISSFV